MVRIKRPTAIAIGTLLGASALAVTPAVHAHTAGDTSDPARGGVPEGFHSESEIDAVWSEYVASYDVELPTGVKFPEAAPKFFHPDDVSGKTQIFQDGLVGEIAAQYWRCSWLGVIVSHETGKGASEGEAVKAKGMLESDSVGPGSRVAPREADTYHQGIKEYAADIGTTSAQLEYQYDCSELMAES